MTPSSFHAKSEPEWYKQWMKKQEAVTLDLNEPEPEPQPVSQDEPPKEEPPPPVQTLPAETAPTAPFPSPPSAAIADGVPMTVDQMQRYLQELYGFPVVLRQQGTTKINNCPCCGESHEHSPETEHHPGKCEEHERNIMLTIGSRSFVPNYGCTILSYVSDDRVNKLTAM